MKDYHLNYLISNAVLAKRAGPLWPMAHPNPPKARQKRGEAGPVELGRRAQHSSPPHLKAGWRVDELTRQKIKKYK